MTQLQSVPFCHKAKPDQETFTLIFAIILPTLAMTYSIPFDFALALPVFLLITTMDFFEV